MTQENQEGPAELLLAWGAPGNPSKSSSRGGFTSLLVLGGIFPGIFSSGFDFFTSAACVHWHLGISVV